MSKDWIPQWDIALGKEELPKRIGVLLLLVRVYQVQELIGVRKAGAVILCKTNVGHSLMISETINHLWGRTLNPYNRSLTTGASSGGEGALIGFHGSPLGFGTDIGGSIRVPAA
jgi:hypothetical protein